MWGRLCSSVAVHPPTEPHPLNSRVPLGRASPRCGVDECPQGTHLENDVEVTLAKKRGFPLWEPRAPPK